MNIISFQVNRTILNIILGLISFTPLVHFSQNEANIWYFGDHAGIDFNSGSPVPLTNGQLVTLEGCATACDNNGDLLFYTDGRKIWNRNHNVMPNGFGLLGDSSSTQSAIVVKQPGSSTIYYVFTVAQLGGSDGLRYSQVDMSLQGGLGDVNMMKNVLIVTPTCEKINAVKHQNGSDFWIVTHLFDGSNTFHSYRLTSTGLNMTPVASNVGTVVPTSLVDYTLGYLKSNTNGDRIAAARYSLNNLEIYDFDKLTGQLSNPVTLTGFNGQTFVGGAYGVEFSPNGNLLYVSENAGPINNVYQYNLLAGSQSAIDASRLILATPNPLFSGALQLAPDGKIYHAVIDEPNLGVINNPDILGTGCNYAANGVFLAGRTSLGGLPNFSSSFLLTTGFTANDLCLGDSTRFTILSSSPIDSVEWNFGDPGSGIHNISNDTMPAHLFTTSGTFNVTVIVYSMGNSDTTANQITIQTAPIINLGNDTNLCNGQNLVLDATLPNASYIWQDNSNNATFNVTQAGTYWVEVSSPCISFDTIVVTFDIPLSIINLGNDTALCPDEIIVLDPGIANGSFLWQDNSTNSNYIVNEPGSYWVEVSNACGSSYDTLVVTGKNCEAILVMPNVFSPNGDGDNELFIPKKIEGVNEANISVFNRWGQKIHESSDIILGWDGTTTSGSEAPSGTYFWVINFSDANNDSSAIKGYVTLLR